MTEQRNKEVTFLLAADPRAVALDLDQVAERLRRSRATVARWVKEGRLPAKRIGGGFSGIVVIEADLAEFLANAEDARP